jgi:hypothetical protein
MKAGLCAMPPKQSVETHSVWCLVPPPTHPGVNWELLPDGAQEVEPVRGHRGWVVEFHNHISDVVVQDGHQALCNLKVLLTSLKQRHPQLTTCSRETDGAVAYNSVAVALLTPQLGVLTGIRVTEHSHNEPGGCTTHTRAPRTRTHACYVQVTAPTSATLLGLTRFDSA